VTSKNINLIVIADDDADDRMLISEAFEENNIDCAVHYVEDGTELLDFLNKRGKYTSLTSQLPDLILLDINMPRKNGKQALQDIKSCERTKHIPVVMFSTSNALDEINYTYALGANSFIVKPSSYKGFLEVVGNLKNYWFETVSVKKVLKL
jgi:two-component system, response regulator